MKNGFHVFLRMFTKFVREHGLTRLAVCLCVAQLASPNAFASPTTTKCFTDVMVVGGSDGDDLKTHYTSLGYTVIGQDLNEGAGGDYIYTVYPALEDGLSSCITDVIVRTEDYPAGFTFNGRKYHSTCGADYCSESFTSSECSLNSGTDGTKMWLYFTKEPFPDRRVVTDIAFTTGDVKVKEGYTTVGRNGAVVGTDGSGAVDLNEGASSGNNNVFMHVSVPPIYMHVSTSTMPISTDMPEYISDVVVFGGEKNEVNALKDRYASQEWTVINKDLNADAGGDDVYMAYKKSSFNDNGKGFITDFIIKTGDYPDQFTFEGRVYYRAPHYGSPHFESHGGNLNSKTKENSTNMRLYFTRDLFPDNRVVTDIAFTTGKDNKTKEGYTTLGENGAVVGSDGSGAMDLNEGAGGDYIYMHFSTFNDFSTVTFVSGSKNIVIAPKLIYNGKKLDKPSDPVRPGFTFLGWFTTADGDALFDFNTPITSDVSLYAQWRWDGGDLSNVDMDDDYVARDGFELTGKLASNSKISIEDKATVTLKNVTISGVSDEKYGWAGLTCLGDCKIVLAEGSENSVKGFWEDYPGIYVPKGKTLTIEGSGSLDASSNGWGAGLCGGFNMDCGNVDIRSGIVIATGGKNAAGIGLGEARGKNTSCGNITIGGTKTKVTTTAGDGGPYSIGIGKVTEGGQSTVGTITIGGNETTDISESPFIYDKRNLLTHTDITVAAIADQTYTGSEICPDVVVKDGETQLVAGVNYTVECTENISAGTANMTIIGKIGYAGSISKTFKIVPKGITIAWGEQTSFVYNGTEQAPKATARGLVNGDDCTITVSGAAKNAGSYTAKATELSNGNYKLPTENLEKPFEITPKEITIAWGEQTSFVYNGMEQSPTATAEGLINGDECTITVSGAAKNAGKHTAKATELSNGNYKLPTENLEKPFVIVINLASLESDFVAQDGEALTGELLASDYRIEIADGATVTLYSVLIYDVSRPGISCKGDCDIILAENSENTVMGSSGIYVPGGHTLTISGTGFLDVRGYDYAGIGCDLEGVAGNITISGGSITATGGYKGAGIGCSLEGVVENITISGGTITAKGDGDGAGIGSGAEGSVKNITISGGSITATGGYKGAGIGGGIFASVEDIMISGGTITATGDDGGAGIGSGRQGSVKNITISGGKVTANAGRNSVGIGSGLGGYAHCSVILGWTNEDDFIYASRYGNVETIQFADGKSFYYEENGKGVVVEDVDNIGGKTLRPFYGNKKSLKYAFVSGIQPSYYYTGEEITLPYKVTDFEGKELIEGTDYTASLDKSLVKDAGDYTLTITAKGSGVYTGSKTVSFSVVKFDLENAVVSGVKPYYLYTGEEIAVTYKVSDTEGKELVEGAGYTATFSPLPIRDKGNYTFTIAAKDGGVYTGSKTISFTVGDAIPVTISTTQMTNGIYRVSSDVTIDERIVISGHVMLVLDKGKTLTASKGIEVSSKNKLTIDGKGSLNAIGVDNTAGIGSGYDETGGTVTINGGTITATGGKDAAGIGSGCYGTSVTVTINGGIITATGGEYAAGIGSGYDGTSVTVTINGGTITATGGKDAAGVGSGYYGTSGTVTINGGTITATGGKDAAGVGGGYCGSVGNIAINGDETKVTATKGENAPYSIGEGYGGSRTGSITIGGIETSDISESPFVYPKTTDYAAVQIRGYNSGTRAVIDGEYSGTDAVNIPKDTAVASVVYNRKFLKDTYSTMVLPFSVKTENVSGLNAVLYYNGIGKDANNNDAIRMKVLWAADGVINDDKGNPVFYKDTVMKANTPYLVLMNNETFAVEGPVTIVPTADAVTKYDNLEWEFRGVWEYKKWDTGDRELGYAYGFAASAPENSKIKVGDFVKIGEGTHINPLRAYLVSSNIPETTTPTQGIRANGDYVKRPTVTQKELPELMSIIIDGLGDNGNGTTVIGQFNTRTGEFKMNNAATKRTFDVKGRRVNGTNKARGAYYGKKTTARHPER